MKESFTRADPDILCLFAKMRYIRVCFCFSTKTMMSSIFMHAARGFRCKIVIDISLDDLFISLQPRSRPQSINLSDLNSVTSSQTF